jgi:hypothetical protein
MGLLFFDGAVPPAALTGVSAPRLTGCDYNN